MLNDLRSKAGVGFTVMAVFQLVAAITMFNTGNSTMGVLFIICLGLALGCAWWMVTSLKKSMAPLQEYAECLARGDLDKEYHSAATKTSTQ